VNDNLYAFPAPIDSSKSSLLIMWLLPTNTQLATKRSNEGKPESERVKKALTQVDFSVEVSKRSFLDRHRSPFEDLQKVRKITNLVWQA
jgi:hypothetical protein